MRCYAASDRYAAGTECDAMPQVIADIDEVHASCQNPIMSIEAVPLSAVSK